MLVPIIAMLIAGQAAPRLCTAQALPPTGLEGWGTTGNRPIVGTRFIITGAANVAGLTPAERARGGKGAIISISVARADTYAVALSDGAWIDVTQGEGPIVAVGHGHGPACSGIRKIVKFTLKAGLAQLRLSGLKMPKIGVLVAPN